MTPDRLRAVEKEFTQMSGAGLFTATLEPPFDQWRMNNLFYERKKTASIDLFFHMESDGRSYLVRQINNFKGKAYFFEDEIEGRYGMKFIFTAVGGTDVTEDQSAVIVWESL